MEKSKIKTEDIVKTIMLGLFHHSKFIKDRIAEILYNVFDRKSPVMLISNAQVYDGFALPDLGIVIIMHLNENSFIDDITIQLMDTTEIYDNFTLVRMI